MRDEQNSTNNYRVISMVYKIRPTPYENHTRHTTPHVMLCGIPKDDANHSRAPGAGKSSVLTKLQEECATLDAKSVSRVLIISSQEVDYDLSKVIQLIGAVGGLSTKMAYSSKTYQLGIKFVPDCGCDWRA
ncbi:MAG: hypothetical protein OXC62_00305 [Aestuariivita sp.]|nr:hypothetical protein [Aestuariivita sp.]